MSSSVLGLSIDCADAATLAQFWADVLGSSVSPGSRSQDVDLLPALKGRDSFGRRAHAASIRWFALHSRA